MHPPSTADDATLAGFENIFRAYPAVVHALNCVRPKGQPPVAGRQKVTAVARVWRELPAIADLQTTLTRFNLFEALNARDYEVRHSNFLAWLLDPKGSHGFGCDFLDRFLETIAIKAGNRQTATMVKRYLAQPPAKRRPEVLREAEGRIDLLIVDRALRFTCAVENKIHTGEHSNQLVRYREAIERKYAGFDRVFVFLTLRMEVPTDSAYTPLIYAELCQSLIDIASAPPTSESDEVALLLQHYLQFLESPARPTQANLFTALRLREIKHSDFHAWLFDPTATHRLGERPLYEFLRLLVERKPGIRVPPLTGSARPEWQVLREEYNIDLMLVCDRHRFVCCIENKLEAREGPDQLQRYKQYVRTRFTGYETVFVFFTLGGDEPTDSEYLRLAFRDFLPRLKRIVDPLATSEFNNADTVGVLINHYAELLDEKLCLRIKTRTEVAPATDTRCRFVLQQQSALVNVVLSGIRRWQEDVRVEIEAFVGDLIRHAFGDDCYRPGPFRAPFNVYLPFVPKEFDRIRPIRSGGADPAFHGRIFNLLFLNLPFHNPFQNAEPLGVTLRAGMTAAKPGYHELREIIYASAKLNPAVFNCANRERVGAQKNCMLFSETLCTADDLRRGDLSSIKMKLQLRFEMFVAHRYPTMLATLQSASVSSYAPRS